MELHTDYYWLKHKKTQNELHACWLGENHSQKNELLDELRSRIEYIFSYRVSLKNKKFLVDSLYFQIFSITLTLIIKVIAAFMALYWTVSSIYYVRM